MYKAFGHEIDNPIALDLTYNIALKESIEGSQPKKNVYQEACHEDMKDPLELLTIYHDNSILITY